MEPPDESSEARELVRCCLAGDDKAVYAFQQRYGELVYRYPMRVYGVPAEDAAGFYVYAFDDRRIFRRLRTFEGRAPFRAYLVSFVLDHLVVDWKRSERTLETVSLETLGELADGGRAIDGESDSPRANTQSLAQMLARIAPAHALVMKLLYIEDCELQPGDLQQLAQTAGRRVRDVLAAVDRLRATVREREGSLKRIEDALDAVQAWIHLYERRLQRINQDLPSVSGSNASFGGIAERLRAERAEVEAKIRRRQQQRQQLLARAQRRKVTAPYKDIAALLNTSIGNVASLIARARRELAAQQAPKQPVVNEEQLKNGIL